MRTIGKESDWELRPEETINIRDGCKVDEDNDFRLNKTAFTQAAQLKTIGITPSENTLKCLSKFQ